jgi:hypothetical protein
VGVGATHDDLQPVGSQIGLSAGHFVPQVLQLSGFVTSVSHPSSGLLVQWA